MVPQVTASLQILLLLAQEQILVDEIQVIGIEIGRCPFNEG